MKKLQLCQCLLLAAIILIGCQPKITSSQTPSPSPAVTPVPSRTAVISEIDNNIQSRLSQADIYSPAMVGQDLPVGGQALSGELSRCRLDLLPDATIVRLGPSSEFTLDSLQV